MHEHACIVIHQYSSIVVAFKICVICVWPAEQDNFEILNLLDSNMLLVGEMKGKDKTMTHLLSGMPRERLKAE